MPVIFSMDQFSISVVEILGNSVLPGIALVILAQILMLLFQKLNAATRHIIWLFALVVLVALPASNLISGIQFFEQPQNTTQQEQNSDTPQERSSISQPETTQSEISQVTATGNRSGPLSAIRSNWTNRINLIDLAKDLESTEPFAIRLPIDLAYYLFLAWLLGAVALLVRLAGGYLRLQQLKRSSLPLTPDQQILFDFVIANTGIKRRVEIRSSLQVASPMLAGLKNPMILLPQSLIAELSEADLEQIILHELAHLSRRDDITKLFERVVQVLLYFHPAVWWITRKLNFEREVACDDWVLSNTWHDLHSYSSCLLNMVTKIKNQPKPMFTAGLLMARTQIEKRIKILLNKHRLRTTHILKMRTFALSLLMLGSAIFFSQLAPQIAVSHELINQEALRFTLPAELVADANRQAPRSSSQSYHVSVPSPIELEISYPVMLIEHFSFRNGILFLKGPSLTYVVVNQPATYEFKGDLLITRVTIPAGQIRLSYIQGFQNGRFQPCGQPIQTFGTENISVVGSLSLLKVDTETGAETPVVGCPTTLTDKLVLRKFAEDE